MASAFARSGNKARRQCAGVCGGTLHGGAAPAAHARMVADEANDGEKKEDNNGMASIIIISIKNQRGVLDISNNGESINNGSEMMSWTALGGSQGADDAEQRKSRIRVVRDVIARSICRLVPYPALRRGGRVTGHHRWQRTSCARTALLDSGGIMVWMRSSSAMFHRKTLCSIRKC